MKNLGGFIFAFGVIFMARQVSAADVTINVFEAKVATTTTATIRVQATGSENTIQFTLCWNPAVLQYASHAVGSSLSGATEFPNLDQANGRLGMLIGLAPNQVLAAGAVDLLVVNFTAISLAATTLEFRDDVPGFPKKKVISAAAESIISTFSNLSLTGSNQSAAPVILQQPVSVSVAVGGAATFSVTATASPAPTFQWRKNTVPILGATSQVLTLAGVGAGDAGSYDVVVANSGGFITSAAATLTIASMPGAPVVTVQPVSQIDAAPGSTVSLVVEAAGTPTLTYQWSRNAVAIAGATNSALILANLDASMAGNYRVRIENSLGSATSQSTAISVTRPGHFASQAVIGAGYVGGQTVTITNSFSYSGVASALGWSAAIPAGWSYVSSGGSAAASGPSAGQINVLEWAWSTIPASPVTFVYTLLVPPGQEGDREIVSLASVRNGESLQFVADPPRLILRQLLSHSADTNQDFRIGLLELTRVIELYNTRKDNVRTGCYSLAASVTEDGFLPDISRSSTEVSSLGRHHSADTNRDGRIGLLELTRVIELYNYRSAGSRTGQYKLRAGTEDGFEPGPGG